MTARLSPTEIFNGRKIFLIGGTGFLGKVTLSMLLHRFPGVGGVYVTVRARSKEEKAGIVARFLQRFGEDLRAGRVRPVIDRVFPLEKAAEAHRRMKTNEHFGKIVLRVA